MNIRKCVAAIGLSLLPWMAAASSAGVHLESANIDVGNVQSLQRGAQLFNNYCLSCHSAQYMRYSRMAEDLKLPADLVIENLMFAGEKIGETMTVAMPAKDAAVWFGKAPPDLTLTARQRGADWVYTYLKSFYLDPAKPMGVNNLVFKDVGMPHVLWELQGWQRLKPAGGHEDDVGSHATAHESAKESPFEQVTEGALTPEEYDRAVRDLVAYMSYVAEPVQIKRTAVGVWVLLFLAVFGVLAYLLKKEYWKDVH
ncbi:MAG TPA: cytochrome c1 [Candidatus Macondimonas sp.]|nr:cytochrome c1 [Candidatus Macondimonas sp.]